MDTVIDNRRILIIDDNEHIHRDIRRLLAHRDMSADVLELARDILDDEVEWNEPYSYEVDSAYQGEEGVHMAREARLAGRPYAMAFVDMRLPPGMDGLETLERLWVVDSELQCVVITAYSDYTWEDMLERLGPRHDLLILKKPFDAVEIRHFASALTEKWNLFRCNDIITRDLRRTATQWNNTFNAIDEAVFIVDDTLSITHANKTAERLLHEGMVIGKGCCSLVHGDEMAPEHCLARQVLRGERPDRMELQRFGDRWYGLSAYPDCNQVGKVVGVIQVMCDITEKKRAEAERLELERLLQRAEKMEAIGTLAGGIAHDFNNLLTPIMGFGELVQRSLTEGSQSRLDQEKLLQAANRAKELVEQILYVSRQIDQESTTMCLGPLVEEALKLLRSSIPTTIEIRSSIDGEYGAVSALPSHIHQVVMNLCTNAYQAMRESGGVLDVSLSPITLDQGHDDVDLPSGRYMQLAVHDTGCGMDQETARKVFNPYFTTKPRGRGTGMGLAVVQGIVTRHKGAISVESEIGVGTTFRVYFPVSEDAPVKVEPVVHVSTRGHERVLLVDDEPAVLEMEERLLSSLGYHVTAAVDGLEALRLFRSDPSVFDVVISDMTMPRITGADLAVELLKVRADLPIVLVTGYSARIDEASARALGVRQFIMKPFSLRKLAQTVRLALAPQPTEE